MVLYSKKAKVGLEKICKTYTDHLPDNDEIGIHENHLQF